MYCFYTLLSCYIHNQISKENMPFNISEYNYTRYMTSVYFGEFLISGIHINSLSNLGVHEMDVQRHVNASPLPLFITCINALFTLLCSLHVNCIEWYPCQTHKHISISFYWLSFTLFSAWISNHLSINVWDEITYPFPNLNGAIVELWEWISIFIPPFIMGVITQPSWD